MSSSGVNYFLPLEDEKFITFFNRVQLLYKAAFPCIEEFNLAFTPSGTPNIIVSVKRESINFAIEFYKLSSHLYAGNMLKDFRNRFNVEFIFLKTKTDKTDS